MLMTKSPDTRASLILRLRDPADDRETSNPNKSANKSVESAQDPFRHEGVSLRERISPALIEFLSDDFYDHSARRNRVLAHCG
jgi:hypothetical protein